MIERLADKASTGITWIGVKEAPGSPLPASLSTFVSYCLGRLPAPSEKEEGLVVWAVEGEA